MKHNEMKQNDRHNVFVIVIDRSFCSPKIVIVYLKQERYNSTISAILGRFGMK
jgi:hypothetical protein